jgi:hypothetical protein
MVNDDKHVCDEKVVLERAFAAADATQWQGDMTVNFLTMARAARVLAKEVRRLQVYQENCEFLLGEKND